MKHNLIAILATVGAMLAFSGCGKSDSSSQSTGANSTQAASGVRQIELTANDSMKYSLTEIHAQPGEKLKISFTNLGQLPKQAMAHNWVLVMPMSDADIMAFSAAASTRAPEYLPEDKSKILAHTKLLGPKETDTIEISVPNAAGEYPFLCSFPGHAALMRGKLIVSPAKS